MQMLSALKQSASSRLLTYLAIVALIGGLSYLILPKFSYPSLYSGEKTNSQTLSAINHKQNDKDSFKLSDPSAINLPRLNLHLPIAQGDYDFTTKQWTLDYTHAFYTAFFKNPLIYGHNSSGIFGKLNAVQKGDILTIENGDNKTLSFKYSRDIVVKPEDSQLISKDLKNTLMVMTCTGIWDENRRVLLFNYLKSEKS